MYTQRLSSALAGLVVTTGLLYLMQFLIASGEEIITESRPRHFLIWIDTPDLPDTPVEKIQPKRFDKPPLPPETNVADITETDGFHTGVGTFAAPPLPPDRTLSFTGFGISNGPLINIIKVQTQYPASAVARGLDGIVIVQFDVSAMGVVENAVVIDSTNRIFDKAAIEAAYRFRYRPRVVDGTPLAVKGLRQLFKFEMEK